MISRITSGIIALAYIAIAFFAGDPASALKVAGFLLLPLACIWYSDAMGGYTGMNFGTRPAITQTSPGCFVAFGGWLLLFLPIIIGIVGYLSDKE